MKCEELRRDVNKAVSSAPTPLSSKGERRSARGRKRKLNFYEDENQDQENQNENRSKTRRMTKTHQNLTGPGPRRHTVGIVMSRKN